MCYANATIDALCPSLWHFLTNVGLKEKRFAIAMIRISGLYRTFGRDALPSMMRALSGAIFVAETTHALAHQMARAERRTRRS